MRCECWDKVIVVWYLGGCLVEEKDGDDSIDVGFF